MPYLRDFFSKVKLVQGIVPDAHGAGTVNGSEVDTNRCRGIAVFVDAGDVGGAGTLDLKLQETDTSGSGYADVSGAAITQIVAAGTATYDWSGLNTKRYVRLVATVGTNAVDASATLALYDNQLSPNPL